MLKPKPMTSTCPACFLVLLCVVTDIVIATFYTPLPLEYPLHYVPCKLWGTISLFVAPPFPSSLLFQVGYHATVNYVGRRAATGAALYMPHCWLESLAQSHRATTVCVCKGWGGHCWESWHITSSQFQLNDSIPAMSLNTYRVEKLTNEYWKSSLYCYLARLSNLIGNNMSYFSNVILLLSSLVLRYCCY